MRENRQSESSLIIIIISGDFLLHFDGIGSSYLIMSSHVMWGFNVTPTCGGMKQHPKVMALHIYIKCRDRQDEKKNQGMTTAIM